MIKRAKTKIGKTKQQSAIINVATKRLMKDWMEIVKNPLKGINAAPISEKNLFVWHCNLRGYGPYEGGIFHLVFNFPQEYPNKPPSITMCTRIEHPNVIGSTICLDMLQEGSSDKYTGWTSAYTVQSILVQLQAFLFEADVSRVLANIQDPKTYEQKKKEWLSAVKWSVEQSRIYSDKTVGHYPPHKLFPQFPEDAEETKHLFVNENIEKTAEEIENLTTKSELVCFFTRGSFEEDVLGYGISYSKNLRTGAIKSIQTPLDLISLRAFMNHGLRSSSYNEKFTHWIPIFIDDKHGQKAMHLAKRSISIICTGSAKNFHPDQVLEVLPKLMSTMTVEVMAQRKHASIKSLRGYCHFYRLLLEFIKEYPILLEKINQNVKSFIESEEYRHKDQMPNLGEFLAIVPASDYSWNDIRDAYIQESFTRNVFWLLNKYEELEMENSDEFNDEDRLKYSFETTKVSQKLLIFNVFFIEKISKPNESKTREEVSKIFDEHLGRIPIKYEDLFIEMIEKINKVESYSDFFKLIQNDITIDDIVKLLKESVKKSKEKGYHGSNLSVLSPEEFAKQSKQVGLENFLVKIGNEMVLESNEEKWKERCFTRWGFNELPQYLINNLDNSWRKLYLQNNLQDVISNLNDSSDFNYFHQTLDYSIEIPRLEIQMFNPEKLKSKYYFLTCVLTKLKNLDTLVISRGEDGLGVKGFRALIKGLSNNPGKLQNLILDSCDINSQSIQELTKGRLVSSNLRRIVLNGNPIGEQGATYLGEFLRRHENLPHLTELDLSRCSIGEVGAKAIAEALLVKKELKLLNFVGNPANGGLSQLFQNLSYSTSVEQIDFSKSNSSYDSGDNSIGKLLDLSVSLKKLNLWKTTGLSNLSQTVFNKLSKSTLKELDMAETGFKNMKFFANALKDNLSLEDLNLMGNGITCSDLYSFYEELICLYNKANPQKKQSTNAKDSDDQSNQPPPQMINLKRIILSNNRMDSYPTNKNKFPRVIGEILKMSPRLVYLDLSKCLITREHMEGIGEALTSKYSLPLKTLLLKNNNLGKFGLKPLVAALQSNTTLEHLDISGNDIGVVGADYLSDIMKENKSIKTLNLFSCFIQIEGAELLSKALLNNTTLTNLDLGLNRIKVRGAMSIVKLLQVNTSLKRVGLKHNHINDKAGLALATAITQENPQSNVTYLALAGNYLTVAKRSDISLLLTSCKERNIEFDLAKLVEVKDPEKQDRTIYITPLPGTVTSQQVKRLFYQNRCGVILNVHILKHKSIESFSEQNYAFVEFAHPDSVQLAMRLQHQNKNVINNTKVRIAKAGIQGLQEDSNKNKPKSQVPKAPRAVVRGGRGGRGGARGGRGGARVPRRR